MLYNQLPQHIQINIPVPHGHGTQAFSSAPASFVWQYPLAYGATLDRQDASGAGRNVPANGAVEIVNLLSCAMVAYIYAPGGNVQHVAVFHAHTGDIPNTEAPTVAKYNILGVAPANIHIVFASSQADTPNNPNNGIQTAADGLFTILNAGVPLANIRVLTSTGTQYGASFQGEVGLCPAYRWSTATLATVLTNTVTTAQNNYNAQFPMGSTKLGLMGSTHDKTKATNRIQHLNLALIGAHNDNARIQAMQTFFGGAGSYKDGSLKLLMTRALEAEIENAINHPLNLGAITPLNAQQRWQHLFQQIQGGHI